MERSLLTWSIPNMLTIWGMLIVLFLVYALGAQLFAHAPWSGGGDTENNEGSF